MTKTSRGKTVATIGIDIGKNSFHLIGMEAEVNVNGLGCQEDMKVEFVGHRVRGQTEKGPPRHLSASQRPSPAKPRIAVQPALMLTRKTKGSTGSS